MAHELTSNKPLNVDGELIEALENELSSLDTEIVPTIHALIDRELFKLRGGVNDFIDVTNNRKTKIRCKVIVPQDQPRSTNYVGKLLGPGGSTLKSLQEATVTRIGILGQGSMRNPEKEQEYLQSGDAKYQHLSQPLHVQIDAIAEPSEAYYRISHALAEIQKAFAPESPQNQHTGFSPFNVTLSQSAIGLSGSPQNSSRGLMGNDGNGGRLYGSSFNQQRASAYGSGYGQSNLHGKSRNGGHSRDKGVRGRTPYNRRGRHSKQELM